MDDIRYKVIEFTKERSDKGRSVDLIPSTWVWYDTDTSEIVAKFMPPPYDGENSALLHSLVKCAAPAPDDWPSYPITIRGEARTYEEALKKLEVLNKKEYAYSTDEENTSKCKALKAANTYKKNKPHDIEKLWDVPDLLDENQNLSMNDTQSDSQKKKRKKHRASTIKVLEDKILKEPFISANTIDPQSDGPSVVLLSEMLPVMEHSDVTMEEIKAMITKGFHSQSLHLTRISTRLEELKNMLSQCNIGKTSENLNFTFPVEKHDLDLPLKSLEDFLAFDNRLLTDEHFRGDMVTNMTQMVNVCAPLQTTVRNIFKKFISRDVIMQHTAVKNTGTKPAMSKTNFYTCVQGVIITKISNTTNAAPICTKDFEQAVGKVINNANDWEGNRTIRNKKITV